MTIIYLYVSNSLLSVAALPNEDCIPMKFSTVEVPNLVFFGKF